MLYAIAHFLRDKLPVIWDFIDILNSYLFFLLSFFAAQPEEAYTFFNPYGFDCKSLKKLQRNRSFLAYILLENGQVASYRSALSASKVKVVEELEHNELYLEILQ